MSLSSEGLDDSPWLYIVLMSVIFKIQVHLTTSSLLCQLARNLTVQQAQITGLQTTLSSVFSRHFHFSHSFSLVD